jgi:hypothetical protein
VGGMFGPLVGTALFAGNSALPYLETAALLVCFLPFALWLADAELRAGTVPPKAPAAPAGIVPQ